MMVQGTQIRRQLLLVLMELLLLLMLLVLLMLLLMLLLVELGRLVEIEIRQATATFSIEETTGLHEIIAQTNFVVAEEGCGSGMHLGLRWTAGEGVTVAHDQSQPVVLHPEQIRCGRGISAATRSSTGTMLAVMEGL